MLCCRQKAGALNQTAEASRPSSGRAAGLQASITHKLASHLKYAAANCLSSLQLAVTIMQSCRRIAGGPRSDFLPVLTAEVIVDRPLLWSSAL